MLGNRIAGRWVGAALAGVLLACALPLAFRGPGSTADPSPSGSPSPPPSEGASGAAPTPASPTPRPPETVQVPAGLASSADATTALQGIVDAAPDGSTIEMPAATTLRLARAVVLEGRHGITIAGNEATLRKTGPPTPFDWGDALRIVASTDIRIRDLTIFGANPTPGQGDPRFGFDSAVHLVAATGVAIERVTIRNMYGDCVNVASGRAAAGGELAWTSGVTIEASTCSGAGRQGISITGGRDVAVRGTTFANIAFTTLDLEPNYGPPAGGVANVLFENNRVTVRDRSRGFVSAGGHGPVDHVTIRNNTVTGGPLSLVVDGASSGYRRTYFTVTGNVSSFPADGPVMLFTSVDHLVVSGNGQPLRSGSLASLNACTDAQVR